MNNINFKTLMNKLNDEATRASEMKALKHAPRGARKPAGWTLNRGSGYLSLPKDLEGTRIAWAEAEGKVYLLTGVDKETYGSKVANKVNGTLRTHLSKALLEALVKQKELTVLSQEKTETKALTITEGKAKAKA